MSRTSVQDLNPVDESRAFILSKEKSIEEIIDHGGMPSYGEELIANVRKLKDGWSGAESIAPTELAIEKLREILITLKKMDLEKIPYVQIENDGEVTLYWDINFEIQCSIGVSSEGEVFAIYTKVSKGTAESESFEITTDEELLSFYNNYFF